MRANIQFLRKQCTFTWTPGAIGVKGSHNANVEAYKKDFTFTAISKCQSNMMRCIISSSLIAFLSSRESHRVPETQHGKLKS